LPPTPRASPSFGCDSTSAASQQGLAADESLASLGRSPLKPDFLRGLTAQTGGQLFEVEKTADLASLFTRILDETLRKVNSDYDAKRFHDLALVGPKIHSVAEGTFYNWMKKRGKLGGQNKVPRLSNSREYVEEILAMI